MRSLITVVVSLLCATPSLAAADPLPAPVAVEIPSAGYVLRAQLFRPSGAGPFPTVIALHGCGGLASRSEAVMPRYRDWAEELVRDGKAVLLPDSYGSRGLGPQCRVKEGRISGRRERVADIVAAQKWLTQQSWALPDRISLLGWASGASALLWAVRPQLPEHVAPDFRSAVAFYPDCRASSGLGWSARVPTAGLPSDDRWCARAQRAHAYRGISRRLSRFRSRQPSGARGGGKRRRRSRAWPCRLGSGGARRCPEAGR